jgi:hypothetical protein
MRTEITINDWFVRDVHPEHRDSHRTVSVVPMGQPQVKATVRPDVAQQLRVEAEPRWPGQGRLALDRLAREAIRRNARKNDGKATRGRARG